MRAAKELTLARYELKDIYERHDVASFRAFISKAVDAEPELAKYVDQPDEVLSDLMYSAKAQLVYLGPVWQEARNHLRAKRFGYANPVDSYAKCVSCEYFRTPPEGAKDPCMYLGATPHDVCCLGFESIEQKP